MSNVISLFKHKVCLDEYKKRIDSCDKLELMEEMVRFQEERSHVEDLTHEMMLKGVYLFQALERRAETHEMYALTRAYRRHLEHELEALKNNF